MKARRVTGRRNERGIAVIVVVGIMVALIMVTTALLGLVNRTTKVSAAIFHNDLARIAALSGKSKALSIVEGITDSASVANWATSEGLVTTTAPTANYIEMYTLGLYPSIRQTVDKSQYYSGQYVAPSRQLINEDNTLAIKLCDISTNGVKTLVATDFDKTAGNAKSAVQDFSGYGLLSSPAYIRKLPVGYFDKDLNAIDFTANPPATPDDSGRLGASFYASRYSIYIQDLNGCLNANSTTPLPRSQIKDIILKAVGSPPDWASDFTGATQIHSFSDLALKVKDKERKYLPYESLLTPWGNTASTYEFKYRTGAPVLGKAILDYFQEKIKGVSGIDTAAVDTFFTDATHGVNFCYEESRDSDSSTFSSLLGTHLPTLVDGGNDAAEKAAFEKIANTIRKYLLNAAAVNDDGVGSAEAAHNLSGGVKEIKFVEAGPANEKYYRVIVRGELINLAKGEILSESNFEMVYEKDQNKVVYQRWFQHE